MGRVTVPALRTRCLSTVIIETAWWRVVIEPSPAMPATVREREAALVESTMSRRTMPLRALRIGRDVT
jgi:hypothetical protein